MIERKTTQGIIHHKGTVTIETKRLRLRKFRMEDAEAMFMNWAGDDEVTRFLSWRTHQGIGITREILRIWINSYKKPDFYNWAVEYKETGKLIGSFSCENISEINFRCDVGYCLSREYWNRGIMTEALKSMIVFLIEEVGFKRVQALHHTGNYASGKVMLKAGMKYEGILRNYILSNRGVLTDCKIYAITENDLMRPTK